MALTPFARVSARIFIAASSVSGLLYDGELPIMSGARVPDHDQPLTNVQARLIGLIYEAVADPSRWALFLEELTEAVQAGKANFSIRDMSEPQFSIAYSHGWPENTRDLYALIAAVDPWRFATAKWPELEVGVDTDLCPREEMEPSAAYREFYLPMDAVHGLGGTVLATPAAQSVIVAVRGAKAGPFGEAEKSVLRPLMPHLKRAAILHGELQSLRRQLSMFTEHLDRYPNALFLTDAAARVLYANAAALDLAAMNDGLSLDNGRITLASVKENAAFRRVVTDASAGRGGPVQRALVSRKSFGEPYRLIVMPAREANAIPMGVAVPAVTILAVDTRLRPQPDVPMLCELFSFTPAEARVAARLAFGQSVDEIAEEARISVDTVRTHLKRILAKTGTARQGELISLVLRSVPIGRR